MWVVELNRIRITNNRSILAGFPGESSYSSDSNIISIAVITVSKIQ